jgi:hypothetical protein
VALGQQAREDLLHRQRVAQYIHETMKNQRYGRYLCLSVN